MKLGEMILEILNGGEKIHEEVVQAMLYASKTSEPVEAWRLGYLCAMDRVVTMIEHYKLAGLDLDKKM